MQEQEVPAYTEVAGEHIHQEKFYDDPTFWVLIGFVLLVVMIGKKGWHAFAGMLDAHAGRIRGELEEAQRLREEAERVLEAYRHSQEESLKEAEALLARARQEAGVLAEKAKDELKSTLEARARMAKEKIEQAEKQAIDELRATVAKITVAAAHALIKEQLQRLPQEELLRSALAEIEQKIH